MCEADERVAAALAEVNRVKTAGLAAPVVESGRGVLPELRKKTRGEELEEHFRHCPYDEVGTHGITSR